MQLISGRNITKEKRHEIVKDVCKFENYQIKTIENMTKKQCIKTNLRINFENRTLEKIVNPNVNINGFDFSEDFDGAQRFNNGKYVLLNLKCIVGNGGAQTRSLREVYWFIKGQLDVLLKSNLIHFANILDGDVCHKNFDKFLYAINKPKYENVRHRIYIGDLEQYFEWLRKLNCI